MLNCRARKIESLGRAQGEQVVEVKELIRIGRIGQARDWTPIRRDIGMKDNVSCKES